MAKQPSDSISSFRSASDIESSNPALETIARLEAQIQALTSLLDQKDQEIVKLQHPPTSSQNAPELQQLRDPAEVEMLRAQLEIVGKERDEYKAKYRDSLRKLHNASFVDPQEYKRLKEEVSSLKELQQARIRAEREAEHDKLQTEMKDQMGGWKRMFTCLERLSVKCVAALSDHEATSAEIRELARQLRTKPNDLRYSLMMEELGYRDAFEELAPLLYAATDRISKTQKRGLPITRVEHRAKILLEVLGRVETISTSDAVKIIAGDEGRVLCRKDALRAMRKAAELEPHKATFSKGSNEGTPSELKRKGGSSY